MLELTGKYQISRDLARYLVQTDQVLPLLDGLDEVSTDSRETCVTAINSYRQGHGSVPTIVTSRLMDYLALSTRLLLRTAVVVQPLTQEQIATYVGSGGEQLAGLRQALQKDAELKALASTPLMLNILNTTYQGVAPGIIMPRDGPGNKQEQLFATYVRRMLARRSTSARFTNEQTTHWLSWLARHMRQQNQAIFYLEQLQPGWLDSRWQLWLYDWSAVRLTGALIGILTLLPLALAYLSYPLLLIAFLLLCGMLGEFLSRRDASRQALIRVTGRHNELLDHAQQLLISIFIGLSFGFLTQFAFPSALFGWSLGISFGSWAGIWSLLLYIFLRNPYNPDTSPRSRFLFARIWQRFIGLEARNRGLLGLPIGLIAGLTIGVIVVLTTHTLPSAVVGFLSTFPPVGVFFGLIGGLFNILITRKGATVQLTDRILWSWKSVGSYLTSKNHIKMTLLLAGLVGIVIGIVYGVLSWILISALTGVSDAIRTAFGGSYASSFDPKSVFITSLISGAQATLIAGGAFGFLYWLLRAVFRGMSSKTIEDRYRAIPNQGIHRSATNGLIAGSICVCTITFPFVLLGVLTRKPSVILALLLIGLVLGLSIGLLIGFLNGGLACLRHYILRFLLWRSGLMPWHAVPFLEATAARLLLRKVGGGYIFRHRLLLDYFADLTTAFVSNDTIESRYDNPSPSVTPSISTPPTEEDVLLAPTAPLVLAQVESPPLLPCGHEYRPNARFCDVCGAPVPQQGAVQTPQIMQDEGDASRLTRREMVRRLSVAGVWLAALGGGIAWCRVSQNAPTVNAPARSTPLDPQKLSKGSLLYTYAGHASSVVGVAWSPNGKRIASGSFDKTVQVWNAADGGNAYTYKGHTQFVNAVAWSPDGKRIASGGDDGTVQVWDATDGSTLYTYERHRDVVNAVTWSSNGRRIASASRDGTVQVWNAADGSNVYTYKGHTSYVNAVAWSPDGKRIASGGDDKTVQVWDATDGSTLYTYERHSDALWSVAWSPDDRRIASCGPDKTVQVWDAADGKNVYTYLGFGSWVDRVAWSPDGKRIASSGYDDTVQVWWAG